MLERQSDALVHGQRLLGVRQLVVALRDDEHVVDADSCTARFGMNKCTHTQQRFDLTKYEEGQHIVQRSPVNSCVREQSHCEDDGHSNAQDSRESDVNLKFISILSQKLRVISFKGWTMIDAYPGLDAVELADNQQHESN